MRILTALSFAVLITWTSDAWAQGASRARWSLRVDRFTGDTVLLYGNQGVLVDVELETESRQGSQEARLWELERGNRSRYEGVTADGMRFEFGLVVGDDPKEARLVATRRANTGSDPLRLRIRAVVRFGRQPVPVRLEPDETGVLQTSLGGVFSRRCDAVFDRARGQAVRFDVGLMRGDKDSILVDRQLVLSDTEVDLLKLSYDEAVQVSSGGDGRVDGEAEALQGPAPVGWVAGPNGSFGSNEIEILQTAVWMAQHWLPLGADTLWLGSDALLTALRDASRPEQDAGASTSEFPRGLQWLNDQLRRVGFRPGVVFNPFIEPREDVWESNASRLLGGEAAPLRPGQEPVRLLDPTSRGAWEFLDSWGELLGQTFRYRDLVLTDQGAIVERWAGAQARWSAPSTPVAKAYTDAIARLQSNLSGGGQLVDYDGSVPLELAPLFEVVGSSPHSTDGWNGVRESLRNTLGGYFTQSGERKSFPGPIALSEPLTIGQVRAGVTLIGLTGQAAFATGDLRRLSAERRSAFEAIIPPQPVRPLDLYTSPGQPDIWNLRLRIVEREWDVVALFNWGERTQLRSVDFATLGWEQPKAPRHIFEFWEQRYLGEARESWTVSVPPTSVRLFLLRRVENRPQVVGVSRHIIPALPEDLAVKWDSDLGVLIGSFKNVPDREYTLHIALRGGDVYWNVDRLQARGAAPFIDDSTGLLTLRFGATPRPPERNTFRMQLSAQPREILALDPPAPLLGTPLDEQVVLRWRGVDGACLYEVHRDGERIARDFDTTFIDRFAPPNQRVRYEVYAIDGLGRRSPGVFATVKSLPARDRGLDQLVPVAIEGPGSWGRSAAGGGQTLEVAGTRFRGWVSQSGAITLHYELLGLYKRFSARVGVSGSGTVVFRALVDGQVVAESEPVTADSPVWPMDVEIAEGQALTLQAEVQGDGFPTSVWGDPRLWVR